MLIEAPVKTFQISYYPFPPCSLLWLLKKIVINDFICNILTLGCCCIWLCYPFFLQFPKLHRNGIPLVHSFPYCIKITFCSASHFIDLTLMIFAHVICLDISQSIFSLQKSIYIVCNLFSTTMWWAFFQVSFFSLESVLRIKHISIIVECGQVYYITIEAVTSPIYFFHRKDERTRCSLNSLILCGVRLLSSKMVGVKWISWF